jgi:hypothetical protein
MIKILEQTPQQAFDKIDRYFLDNKNIDFVTAVSLNYSLGILKDFIKASTIKVVEGDQIND